MKNAPQDPAFHRPFPNRTRVKANSRSDGSGPAGSRGMGCGLGESPALPESNSRVASSLLLALAGLVFGLVAPRAEAQATADPPERMTYQGFLVDGNGVALGNAGPRNYDLEFRIFTLETGGAAQWGEQQTVTVDKGYFSVLLGEGAPLTGVTPRALSTVFKGANASDRWVGITVRGIGSGGANVDILPRLRLLTSPYAFLAQQANRLVQQDNGADLLTSSGSQLTVSGGLRISGNNSLELGAGVSSKQGDAGKLVYGGWTPNTLDIVGGGTTPDNRAIKFWTEGGATFTGPVTVSGNVSGTSFSGTSANFSDAVIAGSYSGNGSGLTSLNAANLASGEVPDARLSANLARRNTDNTFDGHIRVGTVTTPTVTTSPGYGRAVVFSGGPRLSSGWNTDNSDPLWLARYNAGDNSTELRINIGDDPGQSADRLVVGTTSGAGADFNLSGTWTPQVTITAGGAITAGGGITASGLTVNSYNGTTFDVVANVIRVFHANNKAKYFQMYRYDQGVGIQGFGGGWGNASGDFRQITWDGDGNWDVASDRRLKKDIVDAEPMLDRVLKVQVRRFHWKDDADDAKLALGVVAQELQPLFPDLVAEQENPTTQEKTLAVGYSDFGLVAVKALQEFKVKHDAEMAEMKTQLAELRAQMADVLRVNAQLRDQVGRVGVKTASR